LGSLKKKHGGNYSVELKEGKQLLIPVIRRVEKPRVQEIRIPLELILRE